MIFRGYFSLAAASRQVKLGGCGTGVPLLAEAAFAGGTERSGQNCAERVGLSAQLAVQL